MNLGLNPSKYINEQTTLCWLRRDLRLDDNAALYYALKENVDVQPIFIFDSNILNDLEDKTDKRIQFIYETLSHLNEELKQVGASLLTIYGDPVEIFSDIKPRAVYTNHDYESYAKIRDESICKTLETKGIAFKTFKDQVIFETDEILKDDGTPYTVFTPYSKKWKAKLNSFYIKSYPVKKYFDNLKRLENIPFPSIEGIDFTKRDIQFPPRTIKQSIIVTYDKTRNFPFLKGTSRLSVHLRFGTVSIRKLVALAEKKNEVWLNELIWREFYMMILWHFPHVETKSFKPAYDRIEWRNDRNEFQAWCEGRTGYPIVDAGMRELNETGFMHNRVRMITASFLTKHLLIDWRWGEEYFAQKLLDYDLSANNGGWQWAAGSGCDAAPYFRVFNPALQTEKFDPERKYIKQWVREVDTADYPKPIVDHRYARNRVLKVYKAALQSEQKIIYVKSL